MGIYSGITNVYMVIWDIYIYTDLIGILLDYYWILEAILIDTIWDPMLDY